MFILVASVASGCNTPRPLLSAPPTQRPLPAEAGVGSAEVPASAAEPSLTIGQRVWTGRCADIVGRMQTVVARLPSACNADQDCACYPGGISGVTGCGGASDMPTATEIGRIQGEFRAARCEHSINCAPRLCAVRCVRGRCAER